jgi:hypothetical protein
MSDLANRKIGLYISFHVPGRPWEGISMDVLGGLVKTKQGHDYLFVVVDIFNLMVKLIHCTKNVIGDEASKLIF